MTTVQAIPAAWYVDERRFALERMRVLPTGWHYAGTLAQVSEPGSYAAVQAGGVPVVLTRDDRGGLHALANVCAHRCAIVASGCGRRRTLQCGYHGWTYRLDGSLHRAPGLDPADGAGLTRLRLAASGDMAFVSADSGPGFGAVAGPYVDALRDTAGVDPGALELRVRVEHEIGANWKAVVENFIECYHCPLVHPRTLPGYGGDDYLVTDHGPLQVQRLARDRFAFAFLFPVTQLSAYGNERAVVARSLVPVAPAVTRVRLDYWFERGVAEADAARFVDWFESVVAEDVPLCESVQAGLGSGMVEAGLLDPVREAGPVAFHRLLREVLDDA